MFVYEPAGPSILTRIFSLISGRSVNCENTKYSSSKSFDREIARKVRKHSSYLKGYDRTIQIDNRFDVWRHCHVLADNPAY